MNWNYGYTLARSEDVEWGNGTSLLATFGPQNGSINTSFWDPKTENFNFSRRRQTSKTFFRFSYSIITSSVITTVSVRLVARRSAESFYKFNDGPGRSWQTYYTVIIPV